MSLPRYPEYKDSHVEWLVQIPAHWHAPRLKTLLRETDERAGGSDVELLGLSKSLGVVKRSELDQGAATSDDYSKYKVVHPGQLVMNKMQAWNGVFGLSANLGMVSPDYATFKFLRAEVAPFLTLMFRTDVMAGVFFTRCRGMGIAFLRLNTGDFLDIKVPLPPPEEVQAIAAFLDRETVKIDALIAEQEKLIALLAEKHQATISHAVTRGLNPDAPLKDSGVAWLGKVPAHWEAGCLKRFADVIDCKHYTVEFLDEGLPIASIRELRDNRIDLTDSKLTSPREWDFLREGRVPTLGDLVFCRNASVGAVGYVSDTTPSFCMGQDVCLIRPATKSEFMYYQLIAAGTVNQIEALLVGATIRRANVEEIRNFAVTWPPANEQECIATFLDAETDTLDGLKTEAQLAIKLLKERRSTLIAAAVTGQIDVRGSLSATN